MQEALGPSTALWRQGVVQHLRDSGRRIVNLRSFLGAKGVGSQPGLNQTLSQKEDRGRERKGGGRIG